MKNKVRFSAFCKGITVTVLALFVAGIVALRDEPGQLAFFCVLIIPTTLAALYFCPRTVEATSSGVTLRRLLGAPKVFTYDSVSEVDTCYPSLGGIRLCGSGGFFGYWGYFSDIMFGTYFGYYGSRDRCFLLKLKNGRQYVIGCEDPHAMVDYIRSQMAR